MKSKLLLLLLFICAALRVGAAVKVTARVTPSTVAAASAGRLSELAASRSRSKSFTA